MKTILLICKKELKSYFASPIAYVVMAAFALIFGWAFYNSTSMMVRYSFQAQMMGQMPQMSVNDQIVKPLLGFASTIALFLIPMITMRTFAEEKNRGTIELLLTSPATDLQIILGKWLGATLLYLCVLGMSVLNLALLFTAAKPDIKPILVAYLGLILQGAFLLGLGVLISTMTKNQIIAGIVTFFACLFLLLLNWFSGDLMAGTGVDTAWYYKVANYLSISTHFENFNKGVLETRDVVFYLSMIFLSLFLTSRAMEALRGRA